MLRRYALVIFVVAASSAALAQAPRRDGKWEVTTEMDMPGMPIKLPPNTAIQCITKEEAADPQKSVPQSTPMGRGPAPECKVSDYKMTGDKITWTLKCERPEPMTGSGEINYTADTFKGMMTINRGGQTMTMKYSGKRVGDCTK